MKKIKITNSTNERRSKKPTLIAWQVIDRYSTGQCWTKLGAAWKHKDGQGVTLQLDAMPTSGRIVLRKANELPS